VVFNDISLLQDFSLYVAGLSFLNTNQARIENNKKKSKNAGDRRSSRLYPYMLERWDCHPNVPTQKDTARNSADPQCFSIFPCRLLF